MESENSKPKRIRIKTTKVLKKIMGKHFLELNQAVKKGSPKIAWVTSAGPIELLRAMGFLVYLPENHAAILGANKLSNDFIPVANSLGYSPDICSYLTSDIGAYVKKQTPLMLYGMEAVPKPDILVYNNNQCRDVHDWFSFYGCEFNAPVVGINSPTMIGDNIALHMDNVVMQLNNLIHTLEEISGNKFDIDRLKEIIKISDKTTILWKETLETAKNIPSPFTFFDGAIHIGPIVVLRGTQDAVDYYELLKQELQERIDNKIAAVPDEKFRLYWDGMPIWGKLRELSELFASLKTCVVASTYCNGWVFEGFDPNDPFYSMARAYTQVFINRTEEIKEKLFTDVAKEFKVDGMIFHDSKTCPYNSNNRYGMPERIMKKHGIPSLVINGDLTDLRCFSQEQTRTNVEAFIEQLEDSK